MLRNGMLDFAAPGRVAAQSEILHWCTGLKAQTTNRVNRVKFFNPHPLQSSSTR